MTHTICPEVANWRELLTGSGSDPDKLLQHLDSCTDCQQTLETLSAEPSGWEEAALSVADPTRKEMALRRVMDRLKCDEPTVGEDDLPFLLPADKPNLLGRLGDYEVEAEIGRGGMGVVLKAFDPSLNRTVAVKVMSPYLACSSSARRRFIREAQSAAAVCHDHIVPVYEVHEADGLLYLAMQYVAGESLQARLDRCGPLDVADTVRIGLQTASGLAAAHARGLIHRDIKPANLLVEGEPGASATGVSLPPVADAPGSPTPVADAPGSPTPVADAPGSPTPVADAPGSLASAVRVKITDFGLARMADDVGLTQSGVLAGTPEYMSPEQAQGEPVDHRSDLFSLGAVLYAACTGQPPFQGATPLAVLRRVCDEQPTPIRSLNPDVPAWLETLVMRLLAKDPEQRIRSAVEAAGLLENGLAHLRDPEKVAPPQPQAARAGGRLRLGWFCAVGLAVLGLAVVVLAQVLPGPQKQEPVEIYQDFRGGKPLHPRLKIYGPDVAAVTREEKEGLCITLSGTRPIYQPINVAAKFSLSGDFEVTGTYELLAATRPTKGYGVGVTMSIATDGKRHKFVKIGRLVQPKTGSGYTTEYWNNDPPKTYAMKPVPSQAQAGQLRLVREGDILRCLVADPIGAAFRELYQAKLGTEDLGLLQFSVVDSGNPGNSVDARLVDLRIRTGTLVPNQATDAEPAAPAVEQAVSKSWLVMTEIAGSVVILLLVGAGVLVYTRRRKTPAAPPSAEQDKVKPASAGNVSFACSGCGKSIKVKASLVGKKGKCPHCGQSVLVPG